ncbi:dynein axonemal heavy chain 10 [Polistes fuscatus]|uniref:dynein axonemal heavy chain 10 n=1 Tax=Polistes fuscatus TaxID=30207 RepID=UPI001CA8C2E0|nr:dynein axonemal heavy chain 10 [Polistes fuscatus]
MSTIITESFQDNFKKEDEGEMYDAQPDFLELDSRIIWIRERVLRFLGLPGHEHLFDKLIRANNGYYEEKLMNFLNHNLYSITNLENKIIFFYKTYLKEMVQEEIAVWENSSSSEEEIEDEEEESLVKAGGDITMHFMRKGRSRDDGTDMQKFVPPLGEEDKYILTKRMVDKERKKPVIHIICGEIDGQTFDLQNVNFFYFMRINEEAVPPFETYEECLDQMPSNLIVGSINGHFLASLNALLVHVFKPLVNKQFRGPHFGKYYKIEEYGDVLAATDIAKASSTLAEIAESKTSTYRRPSDFRRVSLSLSKKSQETSQIITEKVLDKINDFHDDTEVEGTLIKKSLIERSTLTVPTAEEKIEEEIEAEQSKKDILEYLDKLTLQHTESDILLTIPKIPELESSTVPDEVLLNNKYVINKLEEIIMSWGTHIQQRMLKLLNIILSPIPTAFNHFKNELWKYYNEARDNTKFLLTIMRHFKLISHTDKFKQINNVIPSLLNGLRMIWILSSYYSSEDKMVSLFERISWQLCQNIRTNLSIDKLFNYPLEIVLKKSRDAHEMMKNWKISYLKTRDDIEHTGKGARWEFDQRRLFRETEYIAGVCKDINVVANVLQDFYNIFGTDLKSIIYEPAHIDTIIKRIGLLLEPFKLAEFDVFSPFNKENWEATILRFNAEVSYLENDAKFFIDECFKVLINAKDALEMLFKFKDRKTRVAIREILSSKFEITMQQFNKEIGSVENIYNRGKRNPPLLTYHPPIAGAIFWARQLFYCLKRSVLYFQDIQELKHNELKLMGFSQYLDIGKQLKTFEEIKFNSWIDKAQETVTSIMKSNLLKVIPIEEEYEEDVRKLKNGAIFRTYKRLKGKEQMVMPVGILHKIDQLILRPSIDTLSSIGGSKAMSIKGGSRSIHSQKSQKMTSATSLQNKQIAITQKQKHIDFMQDSILIECRLRFEAKLMEQLGFNLPDIIRNVGIQKNRLRTDIEAVEKIINEYNVIIDKLDKSDIQLLKNTLFSIEKHIQPGFIRFNWNSLSIIDYTKLCEKLLKNLKSIVEQINQLKKELDERIESEIQNYNLVSLNSNASESNNVDESLLSCKTFFVKIETHRTELICAMLKAYQSASPMLLKIESLVEGTSTGRSPTMRLFYEKYEKNIFAAFITCMANNMEFLNKILSDNKVTFQVDAVLVASEVILRPSPNEINNIILHNVQDLLERLKTFPRWMNGTCIECKPQAKDSSEDLFTISFFEDVMSIQVINDLIIAIQDTAYKISVDCWKYLQKWKKYSNLWTFDKNVAGEKFASTKPTLRQYDEKFTFYGGILEELDDMEHNVDISCIRINLKPLMRGIEHHAREWKQVLGNFLLTNTIKEMNEFKEQIEQYRDKIELVITGLERFTMIMQAISDIKKMAIQAEVQYTSYQETFKTLYAHEIVFSEMDEKMAYELQTDWESLYLGALYRASTIITTREKFAEMIQDQIIEFNKELAKFIEDFQNNGPGSVGENLDLGVQKMTEYGKLIEKYDEKRRNLTNSQMLFDLDPADYTTFFKIKEDYEGMEKLFSLYKEQKDARSEWAQTLWVNLNPQQLLDGMEHFIKQFQRFPKAVKKLDIGQTLEINMRNFKNSVPLFVELKNEAMRERHWMDLMQKTGQYFDMNPDRFTLENMFAMDLGRYQEIAQSIVTNAIKELAIEKGVKEIAEIWKNTEFTVIRHFKGLEDRGFVLGPIDELNQILEDNMLNVSSMAASQFIGPFLNVVQNWETIMHTISEVLELWIQLQRKWLYLEGIFVGGDIRLQIPDEARKFDDIDKAYIKIMMDTARKLNVHDCCTIQGRKDEFMSMISGLDRCQKSLTDYLNSKRIIFPRFNFISDDELLSILGSSDPSVIQEHIGKMFDNLDKLSLNLNEEKRTIVTALVSCEKEIMEFKNSVLVEGNIENWMVLVSNEMKISNRYLTKKAVYDYGKIRRPRSEWILDFQGMMILAANQIWWTAEVENVFNKISMGKKQAMKEYLQQLNNQLDEVVSLMGSDSLTNNDRKKLDALLTIDVHIRDIIEGFVRDSIIDPMEFEWESQLRFYWIRDLDNMWINQCTGAFEYGYEYMGLNGRLVVTPLTDRIYLTLTQALSMHLGGAPAGPAGTGKTETTKDLAKALGLLCVVTNCGEGMDYIAIGKTLSGLVQCGAWGCFDEFNRIDVSVLSVISTQLQTIRSALQMKSKYFMFEDYNIPLDTKVGIFITMNPGYAGRTELPESVKALFRPVVCVVPDNELICQIKLFSAGFLTAKILAKKMAVLHKLAQEQLSKQTHYDFGLRAMKSVLNMAGQLKRTSSDLAENLVLMRTLRDMNLPKFIYDDVPLFLGLITDLFPDLDCPRIEYPDFNSAAIKMLEEHNYIVLTEQLEKITQLYEVMMSRHSTMIVGPTGGGKTVIIEILCMTQTYLNIPTSLHILNPKAYTVVELYGILDPTTREWTDGLLSNIFREVNKPLDSEQEEKKYILFDGDVDALWIENMNSVMDDNKLLTLPNQERIKLQNHCSLLFEVGDLLYASPATVSRAGMVYVDPKNLGYQSYIDKWIKSKNENDQKFLAQMCEKYVHGAVNLIIEGMMGLQRVKPLQMIIPQTNLNMVTLKVIQLSYVFDGLYSLLQADEEVLKTKSYLTDQTEQPVQYEYTANREDLLEAMYIQSCYYSLGASLVENSRKAFDDYMKKTTGLMLVEDTTEKPATIRYIPILFNTLYEYFLDIHKKIWIPWKWLVPSYIHDRLKNYSEILVPTKDSCRAIWFINLMNNLQRPTLLVGETGTSKTAIIQDFLRTINSDKYKKLSINFSSRTTSMDVQKSIESAVEKRSREIYGPSPGKKLIIFIDDMNMPMVDTYGTQQPIAFLKLLLERDGFYGRGKDLHWKYIKDICYLAAMGKPGGGRKEVDPRFISMFSVYNVTFPMNETLQYIYKSILRGHLEIFSEEVQSTVDNIVHITLELYQIVLTELLPTPSKFHYIFNMRDLSRIMAGVLQSHPDYFPTVKRFVRLWRNEFTRVICDRLITQDDQNLIKEHIANKIKDTWEEEPALIEYTLRDPLLFGDFRNACYEDEPRYYEDLLDYEAVYNLLLEIYEEYNERNIAKLQMVLFNDALEHLTRVHRILRMHRGHALVVGTSGSGKQSIIRLASFAANSSVFEINLSRGYNENTFREDLKKLYNMIGVENKKVVFLFSASHIINESFLELINNILMTGLVLALFTDEEKDIIITSCRDNALTAGFDITRESVWAFFEKSCIDNLRIALSMNFADDILRIRCRNYPGLVNSTTIDWMFPWPDQALVAVANVTLRDNPNLPQEYREDIVLHMVHVHKSVIERYTVDFLVKLRRKNYVTPKDYLNFINTFLRLLIEKRNYINMQCDRLTGGLQKIEEASITLAELNDILAVQRVKVADQTKNCEQLLASIGESTDIAMEKKEQSVNKQKEIEEKRKLIGKEESEAKVALAAAQPALDAARLALGELDKSDITEIRSFATPPKPVQIVSECVAMLRGIKDISWKGAKGMMSDPSFLRLLQEMNCEQITQRQQQAVRAHLRKSTKMDQMELISKAGYGLYKFVLAVLDYCTVYREVKPKIERVQVLQIESERAQKALEKEERELKRLEKIIEDLNIKYESAMTERQKLQKETHLLQRRLIAADKLIGGLSSENTRWQKELKGLHEEEEKIIGNCLLSSGFLAYCGPFSYEFRNDMIYNDWSRSITERRIPLSEPFNIQTQLSDDIEISKWTSEGLPPDELSVQNGILTLKASRFPLCIDPQQQALEWIKKKERNKNLKIMSFADADFLKQVELAIKYGLPILFQDVDEVDPVLNNVLSKNIQSIAGRTFVMLGSKEVDYDPRFRIYLTTKMSNPVFNPAVYSKSIVINYTVTTAGLEDQLLSVVVRIERPDIEEQRERLIAEISENKNLLRQLENSLLREISMNKGNMLDNIDLIETLENTKSSASEVTTKLFLGEVTAVDLNKLRDGYRPVAKRGAILFFVLTEMPTVNKMYQYSLNNYIEVFILSLRKALPDPTLVKRLRNIIPILTKNIYDYGCTGIFEKHKILYSFKICIDIEQSIDNVKPQQLDFFIKGCVTTKMSSKVNPIKWLASSGWEDLLKLANDFPETFASLPDNITENMDHWKNWYDMDDPESQKFPSNYSAVLKPFEKLMLIRCFRVDRVYRAVINYITEIMGEEYVTPPHVNLDLIFQQSTAMTPIILILSPGSDPTSQLMKLAERYGLGGGKFSYLSLGQNQEKNAIELLETAIFRGQWLMLQNGHLLLHFIKELESYLDNLEKPHPDFRLWLTTDPTPDFPIGILQQSVKVVTEPPNGLKLNLQNTYLKMPPQTLENCNHPAYKHLVYVLAFYHAVVQERRKYDKIGWNISYDFNESDFNVCTSIIDTYLTKALKLNDARIPWNSLKYLIGEVMYGGRIIDSYDRRVSETYMNEFFGDFLFNTFQLFHFYQDSYVDYVIPPEGDHEAYLNFIEELPLVNTPAIFGLHSNAEIGYFNQATKELWANLIELQPQTSKNTTGISKEEFIDNIAKEILERIPLEFDLNKVKKNFGVGVTPSTIVLFQELERINKLINTISKTLSQLRKAIAGEVEMDYILDNISIALYNGILPKEWLRLAPDTRKNLANWMDHFQKRITQYTDWSGANEPIVMWLSGLHVPETYLAALVQITCRRNNWPLDHSLIYTTVTKFTKVDAIEERPEQGCYIHGLYLEGARWDVEEKCLKRSYPKILTEELPILLVIPIQAHRLKLQNTVKTPVYTTSNRRDAMGKGLIFETDLSTEEHVSHWILQGVCLLLNTD